MADEQISTGLKSVDTVPCESCGWPLGPDALNLDLICPCCGYEPEFDGYNTGGSAGYRERWDGKWWDREESKPLIIVRAEARIQELQNENDDLRQQRDVSCRQRDPRE